MYSEYKFWFLIVCSLIISLDFICFVDSKS